MKIAKRIIGKIIKSDKCSRNFRKSRSEKFEDGVVESIKRLYPNLSEKDYRMFAKALIDGRIPQIGSGHNVITVK